MKRFDFDVAIVGGLGHVGLPLGLAFAQKGLSVCLVDREMQRKTGERVAKGEMPFVEHGAEGVLAHVLPKRLLQITYEQGAIAKARHVIVTIGTPVDEYLNPKTRVFLDLFQGLSSYLDPEQLIVIRSTVFPRSCQQALEVLGPEKPWKIAYCPERIAQGYALKELKDFPQIVAGLSPQATLEARALFEKISPETIEVSVSEAELVKLFSNAWRYIQFAVTNQFYMMAHDFGVDYEKVRQAMTRGYGRAASLPGAGFAAGPCLLKDTMQLAAFHSNRFLLGHAAMMVNEGLPQFLVDDLRRRYDLKKTKVGILGMTFKADNDDIRDSLSYKLGKILRFHSAQVLYSDEYAQDPTFIPKEELLQKAEVVIVGVPHSVYKNLVVAGHVEVIDLWNVVQGGKRRFA